MCSTCAIGQQIFIYCPDNKEGLHIGIKNDVGKWGDFAQMCSSDYSQWGAQKRMIEPHVARAYDGTWRAVWQVNDFAPTFAIAYSADLMTWRPQDYPRLSAGGVLAPIVAPEGMGFAVYYRTPKGEAKRVPISFDFRHVGTEEVTNKVPDIKRDTVNIGGKKFGGQLFDLSAYEYDCLINYYNKQHYNAALWRETLMDDSTKLLPKLDLSEMSGKAMATATLNIDFGKTKKISDKLIGVFFEDISYAADGGLYAELIQNRDFEYDGEQKGWDARTSWSSDKEIQIDTKNPLSAVNPHYVVLSDTKIGNKGWDGIHVDKGGKYFFSLFARLVDGKKKSLRVDIVDSGKVLASTTIDIKNKQWTRYEVSLTTNETSKAAELLVSPMGKGSVAVDIVSLFPEDTYKGHRNGLRKDLAEAIAALHPKFVRFPGGCMTHGQGIDNIYHWHHSIGELQDRVPDKNIWHSHQTRGLGFYEFFQWCEDMGAEPLPVLAAGVPCQNSAADKSGMGGQQGGIPMDQMDDYAQEFINLIEWANGDPQKSKWARMRADAGHPSPFNLKYIGVGNEDLISTTFEERMLYIAKKIKEKYPDIEICGTVGPFHDPSSDYVEGWRFAKANKKFIDMVDEHYYENPGWFLNNAHYYDNYDRQGPSVYLGEYSVKVGNRSNMEGALCEAFHLCNVERNADIVRMSSYAPLLCNTLHSNWAPDMIYFRGGDAPSLTPSYYTQMLFGRHSGDTYISSTLSAQPEVIHRTAISVVKDSGSGKTFLKVVNTLPTSLCLTTNTLKSNTTYSFEGISGRPKDKSTNLQQSKISTDAQGRIVLPPYAFYVIEL